MFDHVTIRSSDREASERFYDLVLATLGLGRRPDPVYSEWGDFSVAQASAEKPVTRRLHVGFRAGSRELVDEFWRVGTEAGYRSDGEPGERPEYTPEYYGAFLLDPDGNSVEAVIHEIPRQVSIDHLWIRVRDLDESRRFYELVSPWTGFGPRGRHKFGVGFACPQGSFSLIPGEPTEHAHVAFPASDNGSVDAFHRAALGAGYRDNGRPGERPEYHAGYYGAFVLDPDGNNVEVVNHNR
ncbi:MAG TPA: VOC family protein [Gaiellaceae bacterium]|nr:VOC family protein [Gaiellaceae bacterium]